ncbi:PRC-barrel domain-containing protein [Usitatibacter palustris]|uniref:PRC-barrel domain-containing protein n=1 Tax=Usitatibacter palustris TaxID=2732487 RepID=A0A6M4H664_9PROT|nr:PRC-barrel domain-containing protein [Usitatibacter palustris]QJR15139.1 hypothetical protein DSM104440_01956 [Usitatibacter palustris]
MATYNSSTTTTPPPIPGSGGARIVGGQDDTSGPGPEVMSASTLEGDSVVNRQGETLGDISEIMIDVRSGTVAYAVLSCGGFLGIGDKLFAIPFSALTLDAERKCFVLDINKERLEAAPGFNKDHWPAFANMAYATDLHTYYNVRPYWQRPENLQ